MSAEIINTADGILAVRLSGKVTLPELQSMRQEAALALQKHSPMPILALADDFAGWDWESGGEWQDKSWQKENDKYIGKLAIVGEKRWEELAFMFISARKFPIEYFQSEDVDKARQWLALKA